MANSFPNSLQIENWNSGARLRGLTTYILIVVLLITSLIIPTFIKRRLVRALNWIKFLWTNSVGWKKPYVMWLDYELAFLSFTLLKYLKRQTQKRRDQLLTKAKTVEFWSLLGYFSPLDLKSFIFHQDDGLKDESTENEAAFVCTTSHAGSIQLHLTTESEPVAYLLVGSLKAIALRLYDTQTDIRLMSYSNDPRRFRSVAINYNWAYARILTTVVVRSLLGCAMFTDL